MKESTDRVLVLELTHTGERLVLRRVRTGDGVEELLLEGSLPSQRQGPPFHVHAFEDEHGKVVSGTLSAAVDGDTIQIAAGGSARFPKGRVHRWWNEGEQEVTFRGVVTPVVDLDRFLQGLFEVLNAGETGRPPLFYLAHVLFRHRRTQIALIMPRLLQAVIIPTAVVAGKLLGKYRGSDWPGCPARCAGAPLASADPDAGRALLSES